MEKPSHICKVCFNTDFALAFDSSIWNRDGAKVRVHHLSIASLRRSALQGCHLCLFFIEVLGYPLRIQEPEPWGRYETKKTKKAKKKARRLFDTTRRDEEKLGPCFVWRIPIQNLHPEYGPHNGAISGFRYGPRDADVALGLTANDDSPESIGTRNLLNHTDAGLCRDWIKQCQSKHHSCPQSIETNLPTRLIDIGEPSTKIAPRLIEARGQKGQYVTLSHCWGKSKPPSTTKANLSDQLHSMPLDLMPKTFRDAIKIVRSLGYRYIWIDSYCIVQDDDADWERECAAMAAVYSNCVVTLAAPFANDCHAGFPRGLHPIPATTWCEMPVIWPGAADPDSIRIFHPFNWNTGQVFWDDSPLAERAWVFQEHLLSPRWLFFGRESLYFECRTAKFEEHLRVPLAFSADQFITHSYASKDTMNFTTYGEGLSKWYSMLRRYSNLCLTYGSDRLPALSGIVSKFAAKLEDQYIAGLWRKDIVFGLIFSVCWDDNPLRSMNPPSIPGPSWSWYSCDRKVQTRISPSTRRNVQYSGGTHDRNLFDIPECFGPLIEVLSISASPIGQNNFGAVRNAKIIVKGRLKLMRCVSDHIYSDEDNEILGMLSMDHLDTNGAEIPTVLMLPIAVCGNWVDDSITYARSWHALALEKVMSEPETYRRIGIINDFDENRYVAIGSEDSVRLKIWTSLFTGEMQELHLV